MGKSSKKMRVPLNGGERRSVGIADVMVHRDPDWLKQFDLSA